MEETAFVDYYELMQISPNADPDTIQGVYGLLAVRFQLCRDKADELKAPETGRFVLLDEARRILSDPESRTAYDLIYWAKREEPPELSKPNQFAADIERERNRRTGILDSLYIRRRRNGDQPGMSLLEFESQMAFQREQLMFTIWYLQSKGLIQRGEESNYAITVEGVDHVEQHVSDNTVRP